LKIEKFSKKGRKIIAAFFIDKICLRKRAWQERWIVAGKLFDSLFKEGRRGFPQTLPHPDWGVARKEVKFS